MILWFSAAGLCALAIGFIAWPLLSRRPKTPHPKSNILLLVTFSLLLPTLTFLLYGHWGAYQRLDQAGLVQERMAEVKREISQSGSRQSLIAEFEAHLKLKPLNAKGWYLLGKLYLHDGRHKEAVQALQTAKKLNPDDPETLLALAQALFLAHNNALNAESKKILLQVIKKVPESTLALTLLATDEYNKGHFDQALTYFEQLLPYYSPDSEEGKRLLEIIARAQQHIE